jgi:DNA-binding NarL/FixJ family response regulator
MSDEHAFPRARAAELTPRQLAVASLVARHFTDQQIAATLQINQSTVRVHVTAIAYRIHADQCRVLRTQIAQWWQEQTPELQPDDAVPVA